MRFFGRRICELGKLGYFIVVVYLGPHAPEAVTNLSYSFVFFVGAILKTAPDSIVVVAPICAPVLVCIFKLVSGTTKNAIVSSTYCRTLTRFIRFIG